MKNLKLPLWLLGVFILIGTLIVVSALKNSYKEVFSENENEEQEERETGADKQLSMWFQARAYPDPYYLNEKYERAWEQAKEIKSNQNPYNNQAGRMTSAQWKFIGPDTGIGGRILSIAINPVKTTSLFAGSAGGGIWKSYSGGSKWQPVTTGFPVMGVSSLIINPVDTNIIYAGTGEMYRLDSTGGTPNPTNIGFNVWKTRGTYGIGILKSKDGGYTWAKVFDTTTANIFAIQMLKFDPTDPNTIYACATTGLYRTTNAGVTWSNILPKTYVSDVVINAKNKNEIVASVGNLLNKDKGMYKSTNGGSSWTKITSGLPTSFQGFIRMDNIPTVGNRDTIVASIGVSEVTGVNELYRSTDFGSTWSSLTSSTHTQWQYWFANDVAINPLNTNRFIYGGVKLYSYTITPPTTKNGSTTYSSSTIGTTGVIVHDDIHDGKFDPKDTSVIYVATDGGIYKSTNSGSTFTAMNNGLGATQFYASFGVSKADPKLFVGGLQDNRAVMYNGTGWTILPSWFGGGDGTACAINPKNDNNIIACSDARGIYRSANKGVSGGQVATYWGKSADSRTAFVAPIAFSPKNPSVVYAGTDNLHKSLDSGKTWSFDAYSTANNYIEAIHKTSIALAVSPIDVNGNKLYISTSPFAQYDNDVDSIYINGSPNVLKTITGDRPFTSIKSTLPNRFVMDFAISSGNDDSVFVALGGFGSSHVYVTGNGGNTWTSIGMGLPDAPFNAILIDPVNPKVIYAGGDLGVYVSPDRGATWYDYNNGFWDAVQVMDIQATADNQLVVATHGKGAFTGPRYTGPLPVIILSFNGEAKNGYNQLQWQVSQESNLKHYELQRSVDGNNYQTISTIPAQDSYAPTSYSYKDADMNTTCFYRLKSVDYDGSYNYSEVVLIRRNNNEGMQVLGNPFHNSINLSFSLLQNAKAQINLYDMNGKLIIREQVKLNAGQTTYAIKNLSMLPIGIYHIEAIVNNNRWSEKVIKK